MTLFLAWSPEPNPPVNRVFNCRPGDEVRILEGELLPPFRSEPTPHRPKREIFTDPGLYVLDRPERPAVYVTARAGFESASEGQLYTFTLYDRSEPPFHVFAKHLNTFLIKRLDTLEN